MSNGVYIPRWRLRRTSRELLSIIGEFESASDNQDGAAEAIGTPADKGELQAAMDEFESTWDDRRYKLNRKLKKLQEHFEGIIEGFEEIDTELSNNLDAS